MYVKYCVLFFQKLKGAKYLVIIPLRFLTIWRQFMYIAVFKEIPLKCGTISV